MPPDDPGLMPNSMRRSVRTAAAGPLLCCILATTAHAQTITEWKLKENLRVGAGSNFAFGYVGQMGSARDRLFIADDLELTVFEFDSDGKLIRRIGRKGDGPGEFQEITDLGFARDTLWVHDRMQNRITFFKANGEPARSERTPPRPQGSAYAYDPVTGYSRTYTFRGITVDGMPLMLDSALPRSDGESSFLLRSKGATSDTIIRLHPGIGGWILTTTDEKTTTRNTFRFGIPFDDASLFDLSSDGRSLIVVHIKDVPARAGQQLFEVIKHDGRGQQVWARQIAYKTQPLTRPLQDSIVRALAKGPFVESRVRSIARFPPQVPPVSLVLAGEDGSIWLRREKRGTQQWWDVLDENGRQTARVLIPGSLSVRAASLRYIIAVTRNELDEQHVVRFELVKGPPAR
jgi:hypothetical protein